METDLLGRVCGERVCVKHGGQPREALPEPMQIRALQKLLMSQKRPFSSRVEALRVLSWCEMLLRVSSGLVASQ